MNWDRSMTMPSLLTSFPHDKEVIHVEFGRQTCAACAVRDQCTRSKTTGREITLRPREQHVALQAARERQTRPEFKLADAARSGIEGSLSQCIRASDLRQARYRGLAKTRLHGCHYRDSNQPCAGDCVVDGGATGPDPPVSLCAAGSI
jgi:hypothetical protein